MKTIVTRSISLVLFGGFLAAQTLRVREEDRVGGVVSIKAVSTAGQLTAERAADLGMHHLRALPPDIRLAKILIAEDPSDLKAEYPRPRACATYQECLEWFERARWPQHALAELIKTRVGTILRFRDGNGYMRRAVLKGSDPTIIRLAGNVYELLHVELMAPAPLLLNRSGGPRRLQMYLKTEGTLLQRECENVTTYLAVMVGSNFLSASFRNDLFFIHSDFFPLRYPFASTGSFPSSKELSTRQAVFCMVDGPMKSCSTFPGTEPTARAGSNHAAVRR